MTPTWITAFVDLPPERYAVGVAFWRAVTGFAISPSRGERSEFATLVPPDGDPYLRVQRTADGSAGVHIDLHRPDQEFRLFHSPGGLTFCEVSELLTRRPEPATWPDGHRSQVDQVCLDIPPSRYEAECAFWAERTGWELRGADTDTEFRSLARPPGQPIRILLQRVGDERPRVTAHLDLATDDRDAETARHERLGARVTRRHDDFTVLADPTGAAYCITDRDLVTGMLEESGSG